MKRKALIIAAPEDLKGVEADTNNIESFLYSDLGGAWNKDDDEMETMYYPTLKQITDFLRNTFADYVFVYYAGHGYYDPKIKGRRLCINNRQDIPTRLLKANTYKQLLIADSCGTILEDFEKGDVIDEWLYESGGEVNSTLYRWHFNNLIRLSSPGFIRIYSSDIGQAAGEDYLGGYFTRSLLQAAYSINDLIPSKKVVFLDSLYAFQIAKKNIRAYDPIQTPSLYRTIGMRYFFPLAIKIKR